MKQDITEISFNYMNWIALVKDRVQKRHFYGEFESFGFINSSNQLIREMNVLGLRRPFCNGVNKAYRKKEALRS
jgi:hypothetical protein